MKKVILTLGLLVLGCNIFAQAPKPNHGNDTVKSVNSLPATIASEEVVFKGDNVSLNGTIFLPKNKAGQKVPAVVIVQEFYGSRDGMTVNKVQHNSYRDLAVHLVGKGFAVLRYDRRCSGKSECNNQATMAVAGDDGVGAVKYLQSRPEINPKNIFVIGHGDGSFIGASIAGHTDLAGFVAINAPGRNASKLLREWAKQGLQDRKVPEADAKKYMDNLEAIIQRLASGGSKTDDFKIDPNDELISKLVKYTEYAYSWLLDDPLAIFPTSKSAVLIIHGGKDRRVPTREGNYITDALQTGEHKDFEAHIVPDLDYFLKQNKSAPSYEVDNDVTRPLDPAFLKLLDDWMAKKLK